MDRKTILGLALLVAGLAAYTVGVFVPYAGRAFSGTAVMVGVTLLAIARRPPRDVA